MQTDQGQPYRPTVIHLPDWQVGNPYLALLAEGIRKAGWNVAFANFSDGYFPLWRLAKSRPDISALHIHWINPYIERLFWPRNPIRFRIKALLLAVDVLLARLSGRRVVWTVHNRLSHETPDAGRERYIRRLLARSVSKLILHSEGAREEFCSLIGRDVRHKIRIIPHGNYSGVYQEDPHLAEQLRLQLGLEPDHTVILFFGAVRQYKGVSRLLATFQQSSDPMLRLVIAGKPQDDDICRTIEAAALADPRIKPYLGMVPEEEVAPLFSLADLVAIPFERTLTSGSVLLAMTLGKALLLPETAKVLGVIDARGANFYRDDTHMLTILNELQRPALQAMGRLNRERAEELDWQAIGRQAAALYT